jgi:hypothetical protein
MRNTYLFFSFIFAIVFFSGCSGLAKSPSAPIPENFPYTNQQHLQAVEHWSIIAQDLANQTIVALDKHQLSKAPIYVKYPPVKTEFSVAFHDFLIDSLVKMGMKVNRSNTNNTVLEYKVQAIEFNTDRDVALINTAAKWTSVGAGILVIRDVMRKSFSSRSTDVMTGAILYDFWKADEGAPKLELLVSSSIVDKNVYLMKTTDIYYANLGDKELYDVNRRQSGSSDRVFDDAFYHQ